MSARKYDPRENHEATNFDKLKEVIVNDLKTRASKTNRNMHTLESHSQGFVGFDRLLNEWMNGQNPIEAAGHYVLSGGRMTYDLDKVVKGISNVYQYPITLGMLPLFVEGKDTFAVKLGQIGYQNVVDTNRLIVAQLPEKNLESGLTLKEIGSVVRKRFASRYDSSTLAFHD